MENEKITIFCFYVFSCSFVCLSVVPFNVCLVFHVIRLLCLCSDVSFRWLCVLRLFPKLNMIGGGMIPRGHTEPDALFCVRSFR